MNKRQFLLGAALGLASASGLAASKGRSASTSGPVMLTITGQISRSNRGGFDPAFDQLLGKHQARFDKALALDWAALQRLSVREIRPTLEYDQQPHRLQGPALLDVLQLARIPTADSTTIRLQALDGYAVKVTLADIKRLGFILATHRDGIALPLGGIGPLWAVLDADRIPELASKALKDRFALCPWGVYHIEVLSA